MGKPSYLNKKHLAQNSDQILFGYLLFFQACSFLLIFCKFKAIVEQLKKAEITFLYEREQSLLFYLFIDSMEYELIYNKDSNIDKDIMIDECARVIVSMMTVKHSNLLS